MAKDLITLKALLVSWHFPPVNTIAGVRIGKLAHFLEKAGYDLRVITVENRHKDRSLSLEIDPERVVRTSFLDVDALVNPITWYEGLRGKLSRARSSGPPVSRPPRSSGQSLLSKLYRDLVFVPDRYVGWCLPLLGAMGRLRRTWTPDVILVSGPPFSAFLAVALFASRAGIPWVAEFRDRWADDPYALIPDWRRVIDRRLEAFTIARSAGLVTVSEPWSRHYAKVYRLPVATAMNGFDPRDFAGLPSEHEEQRLPLRIVYTGFVYPERRDPTRLFEALLASGLAPEAIQLVFYGNRSAYLAASIDRSGVHSYVTVRDPVPYADAIRLQASADVLLLLQWNDPADESNLPGKVFEYLAVRRPILGLGPENGIPARLIRDREAGLFSNDQHTIARQLRLWVDEKRATGRVQALPAQASAGLRRDDQYAKLDTFLGQVVAENGWAKAGSRRVVDAQLKQTLGSPFFSLADTSKLVRPVLCVIVDTEADFDWAGPFSRDAHHFASVQALSSVQAIFDRFKLCPTYLVDYPIASNHAASRVLRDLLERGRCEIGVQMHAWTTPPFEELLCERNSYGSNLPMDLQRAKLARLVEAATRVFGLDPKVFKAGRYGFSDAGADLLEEFGFRVDTSVLPFTDLSEQHGPSFHGVPDRPFWFGRLTPLLELPVTRNFTGVLRACAPRRLHRTIERPIGRRLRLPGIFARLGLLDRLTLTPEGMSLHDMCGLAVSLLADGGKVLTLSFHSPSLAPGNTPYVRTEAELEDFLLRLHRFVEFFFDRMGGQSLTAMELHDILRPETMCAATRV